MSEANSNNTTDMPGSEPGIQSPTRRSLLATGGSAMLVGVMLNDPAISEVRAGWISAETARDPIYAAIEAHREAYATMQAVFAEHTRAHEFADSQVGPRHLEIQSMVEPGTTVEVSCWSDVERAVPCEHFPDLNAHYNELLDERRAAN